MDFLRLSRGYGTQYGMVWLISLQVKHVGMCSLIGIL